MTDRELLERAAKAAGIHGAWWDFPGMDIRHGYSGAIYNEDSGQYWNPLADDGDALRLAIKLNIEISPCPEHDSVTCEPKGDPASTITVEALDDFGVRRAIVRAAAGIAIR